MHSLYTLAASDKLQTPMPLHLLTLETPKKKPREKELPCYATLLSTFPSRLSLHSNNLVNLSIPHLLPNNNTLTIRTLLNL